VQLKLSAPSIAQSAADLVKWPYAFARCCASGAATRALERAGLVSKQPMLLVLGGCNAKEAVRTLAERGLAHRIREVNTPAYSAAEILQLIRYSRGALPDSTFVRAYCAVDVPTRQMRARQFAYADVAFLEIDSSILFTCDGWVMNIARLTERIVSPVEALGREPRDVTHRWLRSGLLQADEAVRAAAAEELLAVMTRGPFSPLDRRVVAGTRAAVAATSDIEGAIEEIRRLLDRPLCLISGPRIYMPDGRPVYHPSGFQRELDVVGRRLGCPVIHPTAMVARLGAARAIGPAPMYYTADGYAALGDDILATARDLLS